MSKPLSWCILALNTTNFTSSAEVFEVGMLGVDGKVFVTQTTPSGYLSSETGYNKEELPDTALDSKGIKAFLARYDVVISHNAFFTAPKVERWLPDKKQRREAGSTLPENIFACSLSQLDWEEERCKKLCCISKDKWERSKMKTTIGRCILLAQTLKKTKLNQLLSTVVGKYSVVTPVGRLAPEDFSMLIDNGFYKHGSLYVKYVETKNAIRPKFPFSVNGSIIPRAKMFIKPFREVER